MRMLAAALFAVMLIITPTPAAVQPQPPQTDLSDHPAVMRRMLADMIDARDFAGADRTIFDAVANSGDARYLAPLIDLGYFARSDRYIDIADAIFYGLRTLSGQDFGFDWRAYMVWASTHSIALPPGYGAFKGEMLAQLVDPQFRRFFGEGVQETAQINLVEVVWGGVRVDGIPALVNAQQISPEAAALEGDNLGFCRDADCRYPAPDELVFGVSLNGDSRAYPLRLLNWHEMANDVIGSAPLYDAPDDNAAVVCRFRAPVPFVARERVGETWVRVAGLSAGCPLAGGWLRDPAELVWAESWETARDVIPEGETLAVQDGVGGSVPGTPVALAYCTLCGAGVLYHPVITLDGQQMALEFGSTGLLMRSNKLMYDRATDTVWNAMTGRPAFGALATSGLTLDRLPVVVTDWATWLAEHPDTSVLSLMTGYPRNYTDGAAYSDYFNDPNFIMFPVWQQDISENARKEVIFALTLNTLQKAYPLRLIVPERVVNDMLGETALVLVARATPERDFFEPGGASVRAYVRGAHTFSASTSSHELLDETGAVWNITEDALVSAGGERLERLPGHLAFWFGWYAFYPETLVYGP